MRTQIMGNLQLINRNHLDWLLMYLDMQMNSHEYYVYSIIINESSWNQRLVGEFTTNLRVYLSLPRPIVDNSANIIEKEYIFPVYSRRNGLEIESMTPSLIVHAYMVHIILSILWLLCLHVLSLHADIHLQRDRFNGIAYSTIWHVGVHQLDHLF